TPGTQPDPVTAQPGQLPVRHRSEFPRPIHTRPGSGESRAAMQCSSVDLHDPGGPITAVSDPSGISTLSPPSAVTAPGPEPFGLTRSSARAACAVMLELIIVVLDSASACRHKPHADSWEACESGCLGGAWAA